MVQSEKDHYGFTIKRIKNISEITADEDRHYVLKIQQVDLHFLYKPAKNPKGLMIGFHGALPKINEVSSFAFPIFRLYKLNQDSVSVLSFSDPVLEHYAPDGLRLSWFMDTEKIQSSLPICNIIKHINQLEGTSNTLFFGTSGGGFPAIQYASMLGQMALVSNSQLSLCEHSLFQVMKDILSKNGDRLIGEEDSKQVVQRYGLPSKILLYTNTLDTLHMEKHSKPFVAFMNTIGHADRIQFRTFEGVPDKPHLTVHHVQWDQPFIEIAKDMLLGVRGLTSDSALPLG
jgi:hypothetical protein